MITVKIILLTILITCLKKANELSTQAIELGKRLTSHMIQTGKQPLLSMTHAR